MSEIIISPAKTLVSVSGWERRAKPEANNQSGATLMLSPAPRTKSRAQNVSEAHILGPLDCGRGI
jgi:hypothetical protein